MKLFINGRFLTQHLTGVQIFAQEICKELDGVIEYEILVPRNQPIINNSLNQKIKKIGSLKGYLWEQVSLPQFIKKQPDCLLLNLCNLAPINLSNQVVTIHDLAFINNKNWFSYPFQKAYNFIIPKIVKNSFSIITVSETIKKELIDTFDIDSNKVTVIYNKISQELINALPKPPLKGYDSKQYFLMVGSNNPRKNFPFVEKIFTNTLVNETLIIVGNNHSSFNAKQQENNKNIIHLKYIDNEELAWLYKNAKALINPSFYEGFGIPNIEAMYFKIPILCSKIAVFEEVCGNYANYFELENTSDFIEKIKNIDLNNNYQNDNRFEFYQSQNRVEQLKHILEL